MMLSDIMPFCTLRLMPRRSKILSFMVLPIAILLWCIGWSLIWIGSKKEPAKIKPFDLRKQLEPTFIVSTLEQQVAT